MLHLSSILPAVIRRASNHKSLDCQLAQEAMRVCIPTTSGACSIDGKSSRALTATVTSIEQDPRRCFCDELLIARLPHAIKMKPRSTRMFLSISQSVAHTFRRIPILQEAYEEYRLQSRQECRVLVKPARGIFGALASSSVALRRLEEATM